MLTLGWSDGFSFAPIDFVMLSSAKLVNRFCEMKEQLSKRSHGYKRRMEALSRKPDAVVRLIERALSVGYAADYVLMDSWFTQAPLLRKLSANGLQVIGMIKDMKQRYRLNGKLLNLKELFSTLPKNKASDILGSVIVETTCACQSSSCSCKTATSDGNGSRSSARTRRSMQRKSFGFTA